MKLTILGGGAAGGNTGRGCSGLLVQEADTSLVIDLGPGTLLELRKHVDYRVISAIIISHYHLDHLLDLGALRYLISYNPNRMERKIELWIAPNIRDRFANWTAAFSNNEDGDFLGESFTLREYDPSNGLEIGRLMVAFAPTVHPESAWAMRVSTGSERDLCYTADTGPAADLTGFMSGAALLISEANESNTPETDSLIRGHPTPREAGRLAREAGALALMLTHLWEENDVNRAAREAADEFGQPVLVARPGLTVSM